MTLTQIQYFLEVCQTMNFTKAAQNLYVSQPSLSRQIQLLETELGVQLLVRSNRNVILTEAGEVFRDEFGKIEERIELAIHKIKDAGKIKKEINIGLFFGLSPSMVSGLVENLNEFFPDYKIYLNKYSSYNLKKAFEMGSLDIVVGLNGLDFAEDDACGCTFEYKPAYFVFSPRVFPETGVPEGPQDFNGKKFICIQDDMAQELVRFQLSILESMGITPSEIVKADNMVATLLYTESASGFSIYTNGTPEGLGVYSIDKDVAVFSMNACWKKDIKLPLKQFFNTYYDYDAAI